MKGFAALASRLGLPGLVFAAALLFLWTFFATEAFAQAVEAARLAGTISSERAEAAVRYAAAWRHGMEGGWPVYMPGFFALAAAVVPWTARLSFGRTAAEGLALLVAAAAVAAALAATGTGLLADSCRRATGFTDRVASALTWRAAGLGVFTAASWMLFVALLVRAARTRKAYLLIPAALPYAALHWARPGAASNLYGEFGGRVGRADPVALASLVMVPLAALVFLAPLLRHGERTG